MVTWGDPLKGGDCSQGESQLRDVKQIRATSGAFAATYLQCFDIFFLVVEFSNVSY